MAKDGTDIENVTGVAFLIDKSRKRKRTYPKEDDSDDKVLGNLAPVARWSDEQLKKACVVTFSALSPPDCNSDATAPDPPLQPSMKGLHDNGWRKLIARSGAFAYDTLVFDHLREIAKQFLERLVIAALTQSEALRTHSDSSRSVLTTDLLLRAIVSLDCQTFYGSGIEDKLKVISSWCRLGRASSVRR